MLYIVSIYEKTDGGMSYVLFETNSESSFRGDDAFLRKLITDYKMPIANVNLTNDQIEIKTWYNDIRYEGLVSKTVGGVIESVKFSGAEYTLLCKVDRDSYKLISSKEIVHYLSRQQLNELIKDNNITNCTIKNGKYKSIGTYSINKNPKFEEEIAKKYDRHVALTTLLGKPMTFEYAVEEQRVKLTKYTGASKDVIIPNFIASIMNYAFDGCGLEAVTLNNGLEYIGSKTFNGCAISELWIPETVKLICPNAFLGNKKLVESDGTYRDTIKMTNKNTVIINRPDNNVYRYRTW